MPEQERKEAIKDILKELHSGADPEVMKQKFQEKLGEADPTEIGRAEEELVREGLPREELRHLCDVHLAVMRDSLGQSPVDVPPGHPIHTFKEEHQRILEFLEKLKETVGQLKENPGLIQEKVPFLRHLAEHLMEVEKHNQREENVLFPYLEKHGITEPPAVMWSEHDDLRALKKTLVQTVDSNDRLEPQEFVRQLEGVTRDLDQMLSSHIFKENNILYPMALQVISDAEWRDIRHACDEMGYCCFTPETAREAEARQDGEAATAPVEGDKIVFPTGTLTKEELLGILNSLPVDITFVNKDDTFTYFNEARERAFNRNRASLGRQVQRCHPQRSVHMVNQILDDFRSGRKDSEHFWIHMGDKYVYISYFAVRNEKGEYLGCLETTQDIAPLQEIKGEKRLL